MEKRAERGVKMNSKLFGATMMALRRKCGMTQAALAKRLNVSDKAVSKWETGLGYPEITLLPEIAAVFGVTVDYLLTGKRRGITVAGNILCDIVKNIDCYPEKGMLANITGISRGVGGCAPNTAMDLAKIDGTMPLSVIGCVGEDESGRYVISQLQRCNIDTGKIVVTDQAPTSFSDVMSLPNGERTFFHARGANALFSPDHINLADLQCCMLHIGYILLLDRFDQADAVYGTIMARFLHDVQGHGIKTSIDVVSDSSGDYAQKVIPALRYSDYVIINEIECCSIWNCSPRKEDGTLDLETLRDAMARTMDCGVGEKVIVHSKEAGFCLSRDGRFTMVPSLDVPEAEIRGSVGAGDAYCAGCLYSLYNHDTDEEMLKFASAAAACNLFAENAVDGMRSQKEIREMMNRYPRKKQPK